jgi:hypothetical protein
VEKHFLWHACHDIVPTKANLCRRKVLTDHCYLICEQKAKTTLHILWHCPLARDVWGVGSAKFHKCVFDGPNFLYVAEGMLEKCDETEFQIFVGTAHRIWLRRNEVVHGGFFLHPKMIARQTLMATRNYHSIMVGIGQWDMNVGSVIPGKWQAPPQRWFKLTGMRAWMQKRGAWVLE